MYAEDILLKLKATCVIWIWKVVCGLRKWVR